MFIQFKCYPLCSNFETHTVLLKNSPLTLYDKQSKKKMPPTDSLDRLIPLIRYRSHPVDQYNEISSSDESTDSSNSPRSRFDYLNDNPWQWNRMISTAAAGNARIRLNSEGNETNDSEIESSEESENKENEEISVCGWNRGLHVCDVCGDISDISSDEDIIMYESSSDEDIIMYDDEIEYVVEPVFEIRRNEYGNMSMENNYGDDDDEDDSHDEYDGDDENDRDPFLSDNIVELRDDEIDLLFGNQTGLWLYNNTGARMNQIANDILYDDDIEMQELP